MSAAQGGASSGLHPVPEIFYDEFSLVVDKVRVRVRARVWVGLG